MLRRSPLVLPLCLFALAACGDGQADLVSVPVVRGAPIDGSADIPADRLTARIDDSQAAEAAAGKTDPELEVTTPPDVAPIDPDDVTAPEVVDDANEAVTEPAEVVAIPEPEDGEANAAEVATEVATEESAAAEEGAAPAPKPLEPDEEGVYHLAFSDLSLEGEDVDNIIDYLLFPDEFEEGEGFEFPEHLKALDGKEITISGYMIPGRIRKNMVKDFMLVRDLAGCCFGGAPNPDEWIDVVMVGDAQAEYLRYLPIKVKGTLTLIGEQDQEGYAVGVYRMKATWAGEED